MLQNLPAELLLKIITSTDVPTLLALRLVSRYFHAIIQIHERSITLALAVHAFTSTTTEDFPVTTHSKNGVADLSWLKELERREGVLRELDPYIHRFSGGVCDCDHLEEQYRHARGLRKLWALSDIFVLSQPCPTDYTPTHTPSAPTASTPAISNPRTAFLQSLPHAVLIELWDTVEILMIELNTAYISQFLQPPISESGATREPWCHIFEKGPEWVLRVLEGKDTGDWAGEKWRWSGVYEEVARVYWRGQRGMVGGED